MKDLLLTVPAAIQQILIQEGMTDPINNRIVQDMTAKEAIIKAVTKDRSRVDTTVLKAGIKDLKVVIITIGAMIDQELQDRMTEMTVKEAIIKAGIKDRSRVDIAVLKADIKDLNKVVITDLRADLIVHKETDARWAEDVLKDLQNSFWLTRSNWHRLKNFTKRCCRFLTPMHMRLLENK